eukprot:jgi/Galph1/2090/GphlegSOOS_G735.1
MPYGFLSNCVIRNSCSCPFYRLKRTQCSRFSFMRFRGICLTPYKSQHIFPVCSVSVERQDWLTAFQGPGLIFSHSQEKYAFDSKQIGGPVVLKETNLDNETVWKMWYYGRSMVFESKANLIELPTGCIGYATSEDGINWKRVFGLEEGGAVLAPNRKCGSDFDSTHTGVSDVMVRKIESDIGTYKVYYIYYFGGDNASTTIKVPSRGKTEQMDLIGLRMLPGLALSTDGFQLTRIRGDMENGALLGISSGEFDGLYCGWPRVVQLDNSQYLMYYHSLVVENGMFVVGMAISPDGFSRWKKLGPLRGLGWENNSYDRKDAFDERGWGTRHVIRDPRDDRKWLMFFEGVSKKGNHSIGLASSEDGLHWSRVVDYPILVAGHERLSNSWDGGAIGCPCAVVQEDKSIWLYYVGFEKKQLGGPFRRTGIGLACSKGTDYTQFDKYSSQLQQSIDK